MKKIKRCLVKKFIFIFFLYSVFCCGTLCAFEEIITIPAESPQGVTLDLEQGEYIVEIVGGAVALFYPINPNYCWLISVAVGTDVEGYQDEPNIGTLYFEPDPPLYAQAKTEQKVLEAAQENYMGTYLRFSLEEDKKVRFWVSDFDYTDNSGLVKLQVRSISDLR